MRSNLRIPATLLAPLVAAALTGCGPSDPARAPSTLFSEQSRELGVDFVHASGEDGAHRLPAIMGAGVALADIDGDRDLDLLLVQSAGVDGSRLYRNLWMETGALRFEDVTADAGLATRCYGTGAAAADFDNDGDPDLYLTCVDRNELWVNDGRGRFEERAEELGLAFDGWSTAAAWWDLDADGLLDLWVGNYLLYSERNHRECRGPGGVVDYCGPLTYDPLPNRLMRNTGAGFEDVTAARGLATAASAPALGAVVADFDGNGSTDLYVANDAWPNELWLNRGERFEEVALLAGAAVNTDGLAEGSMGVDAGDFDGDGDDDLVMVHLADEKATLYAQGGGGLFEDRSLTSGLGPATRGSTGFGAGWIDADMDGDLDLLIVNGRVKLPDGAAVSASSRSPYAQTPLLLGNLGAGRLEDWSARAGSIFRTAAISRGAAFGDLDNDGDLDVVVNNIDAAPWILVGEADPGERWIGIELIEHGRAAHGARAGLVLEDGRSVWRRVRVEGSYAASNDPRIVFALDGGSAPAELRLRWSDGTEQRVDASRLRPGAYVRIERAPSAIGPDRVE